MTKSELLDIAGRLTEFANKLQGSDYVEFPDGGLGCRVEHWGVKHLAKSFMDTFEEGGDPPNYLVMVVGHPDDRQVEVTLRPLDGKDRRTPAMDVAAMKHRIEELEAQLAGANQLLDEEEADGKKKWCNHLFRPLQNFHCKVIGQKCVHCGHEEIPAKQGVFT